MKFSNRIPQIYFALKKKFGVSWDGGVIIAYGDTIYSKHPIPSDWEVHESVHLEQQRKFGNPAMWYKKYMESPEFRLSQEMEAYKAQAKFIRENPEIKNKKKMIEGIAEVLSSSMYGKVISHADALESLK